jgi:aryl-alcohol dehydrogenase-like predicted oxidoreductase
VALGAGNFGTGTPAGDIDQTTANRMVGIALDAGVNLFDSADVYGGGQSQELLGKALGPRRRDIILATKFHNRTGPWPNDAGQSRVHLMKALENSLRELNTDWIDLYQIHQFDPLTRFDETLRGLDDAISQGKIRYIGCSNLTAWQIMKASKIAALHGWDDFVSVQAYYSLVGRDIERELVPMIQEENVALLAYSALAGGFLSGRVTRDHGPPPGTRRSHFDFPPVDLERGYRVIDVLLEVAARKSRTVPEIALAWVLHQPHVTSVILGANRVEQLETTLKSVHVELSQEDLDQINVASRLTREFPSWAKDFSVPRRPLTDAEFQAWMKKAERG